MGEYNHTIDTKGRLIIPSKFRELLGEQFVAARGMDGCLFLFSVEVWKTYEEKLMQMSIIDKNARAFSRYFIAGARTCDIDKQGRALIPGTLREYAKLEKDVVLAGILNRIELWDKERYDKENTFDNMDEIAGQLAATLNFSI